MQPGCPDADPATLQPVVCSAAGVTWAARTSTRSRPERSRAFQHRLHHGHLRSPAGESEELNCKWFLDRCQVPVEVIAAVPDRHDLPEMVIAAKQIGLSSFRQTPADRCAEAGDDLVFPVRRNPGAHRADHTGHADPLSSRIIRADLPDRTSLRRIVR